MVSAITAPHPRRRDRVQPGERAAGEPHRRLPARQVGDAEIGMEHAHAEPGAERLGAGLLGGEPLGVGRRAQRLGAALRPRPLGLGEDAR